MLDASGLLDYLNIWVGIQPGEVSVRYHVPSYYNAPGEFAWRPEGIKELVSLPVIGIGRINNPALAEEMLANGKMDLVGMVRELIADPHFPNKAKTGTGGGHSDLHSLQPELCRPPRAGACPSPASTTR